MVGIFSSEPFYTRYVKLPTDQDPPPDEIHNNLHFWPFFKDTIGALDGTHINCNPPSSERTLSRNRKGGITQNCLAVCSFDMLFLYFLSGWEGSAADATLFYNAWLMDFPILDGKYYLADAGFSSCDQLLVPYRGVRYHLAEWQRAGLR
jgi:hypothetical protein